MIMVKKGLNSKYSKNPNPNHMGSMENLEPSESMWENNGGKPEVKSWGKSLTTVLVPFRQTRVNSMKNWNLLCFQQ